MAVVTLQREIAAGTKYDTTTDSSADWPSVANSTYFFDKATNLTYFKNSGGTVLELFSATGTGTVTSVGLTTGTTGTDVNVSGSPVTGASSITLNIPTASATNTGKLSSTDWTTFNTKASLASPAFTGNPTAPTPAQGDNDTSIATTAFVTNAISKQPEVIQAAASDETTNLTTGTAKVTFRMPYAMTLTAVRASLSTAQTAGALLTVDINLNGISVLGTKLTFDNTEKTTLTAVTPATIVTSALTNDGEITVDIDTVGTAGAKGLKITLIGTRT